MDQVEEDDGKRQEDQVEEDDGKHQDRVEEAGDEGQEDQGGREVLEVVEAFFCLQ